MRPDEISGPVTTGTKARGNPNVIVTIDPEAVKVALDDVVTGAGVEVLLSAALDGAGHDGGRITELSARDFGGQRLRFTAGAYVDASGDASLTALAAAAMVG
jgi:FAD dependent oxidoreductase